MDTLNEGNGRLAIRRREPQIPLLQLVGDYQGYHLLKSTTAFRAKTSDSEKLQHRNHLSRPVHTLNTLSPQNLADDFAVKAIIKDWNGRAFEHPHYDCGCGDFRPAGRVRCPVMA